jgi:putative addiction module component (TIGR02574 family)
MTSMTRIEVLQAALALPLDERLTVAREIVLSVEREGADLSEAEWDAAWADEAERRHREVEEGEVKMIPGDEVMARARALLRS